MRFYRITSPYPDSKPVHVCTKAEAQGEVKSFIVSDRSMLVIELIEIDTSQKTICDLLNAVGCDSKVVSTWRAKPSGALVVLGDGE